MRRVAVWWGEAGGGRGGEGRRLVMRPPHRLAIHLEDRLGKAGKGHRCEEV